MNWNDFKNIFDECELVENKILVKADFLKVVEFIKNEYHFELLKEIIAQEKENGDIKLIYRLYNIVDEEEVLLMVEVQNEAESVSKIFDSAVADEKEIYDLFGVKFIGNDELKRLYLPESWDGHPLRKNYVDKDERLKWND